MSLSVINMWHERARPKPTVDDLAVQIGCHFEEVVEMLETMTFSDHTTARAPGSTTAAHLYLKQMADRLKSGEMMAIIEDRKEMLDSLADQIVTAVGVGHCAKMNVPEACLRVNRSNWSKYDRDGKPMFDANGKITKGPNYVPPDLEGLY